MRRKRDEYLTFYKSPDDAPSLERMRARLACRIALTFDGRFVSDILDGLLTVIRPLAFWSRDVLEELANNRLGACLTDVSIETNCEAIQVSDVIETGCALAADSDFFKPLRRNKALRSRWLRETMNWIDSAKATHPLPVERNVEFLAQSLGMSRAEKALTLSIAIARDDELLLTLMRVATFEAQSAAAGRLSLLFEVPFDEMRRALAPVGILARLGLANLESFSDFEDIAHAQNTRIYRSLYTPFDDARHFLSSFLKRARPAKIQLGDVAHMRPEFDIAKQLIARALHTREAGVHVLLYGDAGAGKTEFARLLANELRTALFEVDCEDEEGNSANSQERLSGLLLTARALSNRQDAFVLFDEAEDVFPWDFQRLFAPDSAGKTPYGKAWMNRMLETLSVPVIWISNRIDAMDPAYLRRFLLHIRFRELPISAKQRMTERYLKSLAVGTALKQEVARLPSLTPAQLEAASRLGLLCKQEDTSGTEEAIRLQLRGAREVLGLEYQRSGREAPVEFRTEYVNLREPMTVAALLEGLLSHGRAAVCFYGEPGTGKTELAHHIAHELGRELVYKSASDLLSPWVGVTEQKIAEMFSAAETRRDDVVVLLDEADTFLRDRRLAHASWEASQTNEFLAQMERFPGIFICTTNLIDALDRAILRRFVFRVEFLPMKPEQRLGMFCAAFGRQPSPQEIRELHRIGSVVPADFANAARQLRFMHERTKVAPLLLLADEVRARRGEAGARRPIGFIT